jgi:hypothetical protein
LRSAKGRACDAVEALSVTIVNDGDRSAAIPHREKEADQKAKSEENGKLVEKIDSTFLTLTGFSPPPRI